MKPKVTAEFKNGYRPPAGVTATGVASVLARLLAEGEITTERVLAAAQPDTSPIHNICDWEDASAAHQHRLRQCRVFIRGVVITMGRAEPRPFVHVPSIESPPTQAGKYVLADVLASRPDELTRALEEAHRALQSARARVEEIEMMIPDGDTRLDAIRIAFQGFDAVQSALRVLERQPV